jgi:hypothetical protein
MFPLMLTQRLFFFVVFIIIAQIQLYFSASSQVKMIADFDLQYPSEQA